MKKERTLNDGSEAYIRLFSAGQKIELVDGGELMLMENCFYVWLGKFIYFIFQ